MTHTKRLVLFWVCTVAFISLTVPFLFYAFGYRFSFETWQLLRAGGLSIRSTPATGTKIYIDRKLKKETTLLSRRLFLQGLTPRTYLIRVEKEGYFPWEKSLAVKPELVTDIDALLIKDSPSISPLLQGPYSSIAHNSESEQYLNLRTQQNTIITYSIATKRIVPPPAEKASTTPTKLPSVVTDFMDTNSITHSLYDAVGKRLVWWNNDTIRIRWFGGEDFLPIYTETPETELAHTSHPIRAVAFYPGKDAIIAAYSNGIFAIELDGRDRRNIYPFYKGKEPQFVVSLQDQSIYILDAGNLIAIPLE